MRGEVALQRSALIRRALAAVLVSGAVIAAAPTSTHAEGERYTKYETSEEQQLSRVSVGGGSYFELKQAAILPSDAGRTLYFTITVANGGERDLPFSDYWIRVVGLSGAQYTPTMLPADKNKTDIPPQGTLDFSFYAIVGDDSQLQDIMFRITKWDYNAPDLERKMGDIRFNTDDVGYLHPQGGQSTLMVGSVPIDAVITRVNIKKNEKYYVPQITLALTNAGSVSAALPSFQYSIRTSDGVMYPLDIVTSDKMTLQPKVSKDLQLRSSTIPSNVDPTGWELVVTQPVAGVTDYKLNFPVAYFQMPQLGQETAQLGASVEYANSNGLFGYTLEQLQRLPWDDQDLLTAQIKVSNRSDTGLTPPDIRAYFVIDDGVKIEAKPVKIDRQVNLPVGQELHYKLIGKIPYTYRYGAAKLQLQEKMSDQTYSDIAEFALPSDYSPMPAIDYGTKNPASGMDRGLRYSPRAVNTYSDASTKLFEVQVEIENTDKRSNAIPKLVAYFQTPDNALYPTKARELKTKLNPGGKALVSYWAKLPASVNTDDLKLVLGDAVTDTRFSTGDDKPDALVDAAVYSLPLEKKIPDDDLRNLDIYPYKMSIWNISTWLDKSKLQIKFMYRLEKDSYYETSQDGDRLVIQLEDENGTITYGEKFYFEKGPDDDDKYVELNEKLYTMEKSDTQLVFKIQTLKTYRLAVYHEFQGQRKLIASKKIDWFAQTD